MDVASIASLPVTVSDRSGAVAVSVPVPTGSAVPLVPRLDTSSYVPTQTNVSATVLDAPNTQPADLLAQAVKQVNETFSQKGQSLYASFEKDKDTGISVVKIVDKKTNETISQLPPKQMVAFAQSMEASQAMHGKLLHYKA